ncbi:MAG: ABC transporter ATP-binding protein [Chlamydiia bacterium]|nr:ABC transporter ATP-binding protein [Chlamydiia bacterium]
MIRSDALTVHHGKTAVLWNLTFQVPKGVLLGILGPNGAGKSTMLKTLMGLIRPLSGQIECSGKIAYVPQRESIDWDFPITALEVVMMGRFGKLGFFKRLRKADREAALIMLEQVGMKELAHRQINQLSGGQQQKLFIARALMQEADVYLLDEPFAGVDLTTEKAIMEILKRQKEAGKTLLIVHHDLPTVREYFDWVILLNRRLVACGPVKEVFNREHVQSTFRSPTLFDEVATLTAETYQGEVIP